jgi:hypothetical protein
MLRIKRFDIFLIFLPCLKIIICSKYANNKKITIPTIQELVNIPAIIATMKPKNTSATRDVIDGLTKQFAQHQNLLQPEINGKPIVDSREQISRQQPQSEPVNIPTKSGYNISRPIVQQLQIQKTRLEGISDKLKHIQDNLQSSVSKKNVQ